MSTQTMTQPDAVSELGHAERKHDEPTTIGTDRRTTHEQAAAALAHDYLGGDVDTQRRVASTCEEQGILAALVALALPEPLREGFLTAMKGQLSE